jgi:hypothetical protein
MDHDKLLLPVKLVKTLQSTTFCPIIGNQNSWLFFRCCVLSLIFLLVTVIFGLSTVLPSNSIRLIVACTVQDQYSNVSDLFNSFWLRPRTLTFQIGTEGVPHTTYANDFLYSRTWYLVITWAYTGFCRTLIKVKATNVTFLENRISVLTTTQQID